MFMAKTIKPGLSDVNSSRDVVHMGFAECKQTYLYFNEPWSTHLVRVGGWKRGREWSHLACYFISQGFPDLQPQQSSVRHNKKVHTEARSHPITLYESSDFDDLTCVDFVHCFTIQLIKNDTYPSQWLSLSLFIWAKLWSRRLWDERTKTVYQYKYQDNCFTMSVLW